MGSLTVITLGFGLLAEQGQKLSPARSASGAADGVEEEIARNEGACVPVFQALMQEAEAQIPQDTPRSVTEDVRSIARSVEAIRKLKFKKVPTPKFVSGDDLSRRIDEQISEGYPDEEAAFDSKILALVGGAPRGTDVKEVVGEAYSEAVAGYYDHESKEIVMRSLRPGESLTAEDRLTLAHELDHALTDQVLGLPDFGEDPKSEEDDKHFAADALVEGDATLVGYVYAFAALRGANPDELLGGGEASEEVLGRLPHYLERSIIFPYEDGVLFVCHLYGEGGWEAVNQSYRDLPKSTARILFPQHFPAEGMPVDPPNTGTLAAPWEFVEKRGFGGVDVLWLFGAPGGDPKEKVPATNNYAIDWRGGHYAIWKRGENAALGISIVEQEGGVAMCEGATTWYERAFTDDRAAEKLDGERIALSGPIQSAVILCDATFVRVGIGPDLDTARALVAAAPG